MTDQLAVDRLALDDELVRTRWTLHRRPELAFAEHETAALVARRLREIGLQPRTGVGVTGVVVDLDGGRPGPTLLLRADMDALPLDEIAGREYGSRVAGVMHACGHDAHTSALLGVAALIAPRRTTLAGRVRLLFQPAEEIGQGAHAMIADGVLDGVDEALAAHVFSGLAYGQVAVRTGDMLAGADTFELEVSGGGGHAAWAHEARDAVFAAAQLVGALQSIVARETSPSRTLVLSIASIQGGSAANIVAQRVTLRGTLRWFDSSERHRALGRIDQIAAGVCSAPRVQHELRMLCSLPVLRCALEPVQLIREAIADCDEATAVDIGPVPAGEDFALVAERVPTGYCMVGAAREGCGAHHAPDFDIDDRAIGLSTEILARAAFKRLA